MAPEKHENWFGYARVSTEDQDLNRQLHALRVVCARVWQEKESTRKELAERDRLLDYVREGDTIVVTELTRLGRSARDLLNIADDLKRRGVQLCVLNANGPVDFNDPGQKMTYAVLAAAAEFERDMLSQRIRDGIASAKRHAPDGRYRRSRPPKLDSEKIRVANDLLEAGRSMTDVAKHLQVSRVTLWRALRDG